MKEPLDRNKTNLTHRITALSMIYLKHRGFSPIETEVSVENGWIADIASFCTPNMTETSRLRLRSISRFGLKELDSGEIRFCYGPLLTAIVEVKISRNDFLKDKERKFSGTFPAHLCYLAYPKDMLDENEIPRGWMVLEMTKNGAQIRKRHWTWPQVHPQHPGIVAEFIAAVAIRCDRRTRYATNRAIMKMYRAGKLDD